MILRQCLVLKRVRDGTQAFLAFVGLSVICLIMFFDDLSYQNNFVKLSCPGEKAGQSYKTRCAMEEHNVYK